MTENRKAKIGHILTDLKIGTFSKQWSWTGTALQGRIKSNLKKIPQRNRRCHFDKRDELV